MKKKRPFNLTGEMLLQRLKLPNLKRHCIIRGIPFEEVGTSILGLQSWLLKNYDNPINTDRLNEYDEWIENLLKNRGVNSSLLNPGLKLGYIVEKDDDGNVIKNKRIHGMNRNRKKPRTEDGLLVGTRKAYIVDLQKNGNTKEEVIEMVKEKYPEINESYIITWFNKAKKGKLKK